MIKPETIQREFITSSAWSEFSKNLPELKLYNRKGKSIDLTLNDGQQDDNNKEEEGDVKHNAINFVIITIRRFNFITDTSSSSYTFIEMENEALKKKIRISNQVNKIKFQLPYKFNKLLRYILKYLPSTCHGIFCRPPHPPLGRRIF